MRCEFWKIIMKKFHPRTRDSIDPMSGKRNQFILGPIKHQDWKVTGKSHKGKLWNALGLEKSKFESSSMPPKSYSFDRGFHLLVMGNWLTEILHTHWLPTVFSLSNEWNFTGHVAAFKSSFLQNQGISKFALVGFPSNFSSQFSAS